MTTKYIVKKGDILGKIAKKYLGNSKYYKDIMQVNGLSSDLIKPGQELILPSKNEQPSNKPQKFKDYTVVSGDNLTKISRIFGVDLNNIIQDNYIKNPNNLKIGQRLKIRDNSYHPQIRSQEEIYNIEQEYNKNSDLDIINGYYRRNNPTAFYIIDDKKNNSLGVYQNGILVKSFRAIHGKNSNIDDMTITKTDDSGKLINMGGNMSTPAGYYLSRRTTNYKNAPAFMRQTPYMIEQGYKDGIPSSIHARTITENANTNGCTGMDCKDLKSLGDLLSSQEYTDTYILPVEEGNKFYIRNNQLHFQSNNINETPSYHPIQYNPIEKITHNKTDLKDHNLEVLDQYISGIIDNKQSIQKDLKINDDTYDKLAKASLGILGVESNFGEKHTTLGNFVRAVRKFIDSSNSSPDIYSKYYTYGGNQDYNSVGLTQIRFKYLSDNVKNLYRKYNISKEDLINNPAKAAIATIIKLADEYKRQGQSIDSAIKSWNTKDSYLDMVKKESDNFTLYKMYHKGGKLLGIKNIIGI